jgi:hypothetical protein
MKTSNDCKDSSGRSRFESINDVKVTAQTEDEGKVFHEPVTDQIAPGYSLVITTPKCMCQPHFFVSLFQGLNDITKGLKSSAILTLRDFLEQALLIFENCRTYNAGFVCKLFDFHLIFQPMYVDLANRMEKSLRKHLTRFLKAR